MVYFKKKGKIYDSFGFYMKVIRKLNNEDMKIKQYKIDKRIGREATIIYIYI